MSKHAAVTPTDDGRWDYLEDTYWYVPTPFLPAVVLVNANPPATDTVVDQTIWHIQTVQNGYVIAEVATNVGEGWTYSTLVGTITPQGDVSFSFTPDTVNSDITVGHGTVETIDGATFFVMQMTTGSGVASITHWAYMAETEPGDRSFVSLPGYPGTGVAEVFDNDPSNDGAAASPLQPMFGTDGDDVLPASSGGTGGLLFGEGGSDVLTGSDAVDGLVGGAGKDMMSGGAGADDLYGGTGNDSLNGGAGSDYLEGGAGRDRFILTTAADSAPLDPDIIGDFSAREHDRIDLSQIDAKPSSGGNNAFAFIGGKAFSGHEGELRTETSGGDTVVSCDIDGDTVADVSIILTGRHHLTAHDFVL